jgi:glycosyltransferase involved in cell wall biosynthesis
MPRALVYGDVDMNLLDGSAIWLQSVSQALATAGCDVTLLLKAPVRTERLLEPLRPLESVTIRSPHAENLADQEANLTVAKAVDLLARLDTEGPFDLVVLRGRTLVSTAAADGRFAGRLWSYLTDVPQSVLALTPADAEDLTAIANASRYLLCQTEELRCFLEGSIAAACGKCVLFPPTLPPSDGIHRPDSPAGTPLKLVYTGKFAPLWNTYEMTQIPALLAKRGITAEVHMVGDKVHNDRSDPGYQARMRSALGTPDGALKGVGEVGGGIVWYGGKPRAEAMRIAASCDIGLGWRDPSMDASLELSTKVLEFGALGLPVILNRTPMHEELLGADYPLFAASEDDVADAAAAVAADPALYKLAASRTSTAAAGFTMDRAAARLRTYLDRAVASPSTGAPTLKVVVAGHDLKFFTPLMDYLRLRPGIEIRIDQWASLGEHDVAKSKELAEWADVVLCEWCVPNAVWYSRHAPRDTRVLVHLHRFELYSHYPGQVKIGNVERVVCVSDHYAQLTRDHTGWPSDKVITVPNPLDVLQLDRPKLDGAQFHLGIIGIVPSRKRLDLALDVLEELRRTDDRYQLFVKSKMPWEHWWVWNNPAERAHYQDALRRVQRSKLLAGAVVFDDAGPDVASWLRRVGYVLSTSDDESFHVSPAEGMASRAVPVIRHWPGAETIYDQRWIHDSPADMAAFIASLSDPEAWRKAGDAAHDQAAAFELTSVARAWESLLRCT